MSGADENQIQTRLKPKSAQVASPQGIQGRNSRSGGEGHGPLYASSLSRCEIAICSQMPAGPFTEILQEFRSAHPTPRQLLTPNLCLATGTLQYTTPATLKPAEHVWPRKLKSPPTAETRGVAPDSRQRRVLPHRSNTASAPTYSWPAKIRPSIQASSIPSAVTISSRATSPRPALSSSCSNLDTSTSWRPW